MEEQSYSEVLARLKSVRQTRDPRSIRLAAVASALIDVSGGPDQCSAAKLYAQAMSALEGTLQHDGNLEALSKSMRTQTALLEITQITIPYITPAAILGATFPVASRVLRALVASTGDIDGHNMLETSDELGLANSVLRWTCKTSTELLRHLPEMKGSQAVRQLFVETILVLFQDRRPKVRKTAHGAVMELLTGDETLLCYSVVSKAVTQYSHAELSITWKDRTTEQLVGCMHLSSFLEHAIMFLDYSKLGTDLMELFAALVDLTAFTGSTSEFVAVKTRDTQPVVLMIVSILSCITAMLRDTSDKAQRTLDEFAPRVLASLLQAKPAVMFRSGAAATSILANARTIYGQTIIACLDRLLHSSPDLTCRLLPLSVQMLVQLSQSHDDDDDADDATVANVIMFELTQLFRSRLESFLDFQGPDLHKRLRKLLSALIKTMDLQFRPAWAASLQTVVALIKPLHDRDLIPEDVRASVQLLLRLRNEVVVGSQSQLAVEEAFSALVQGVGIEACWAWIAWKDEARGSNSVIDLESAWILPALKSAALIRQAGPNRLSFFQSEVLRMARACDRISQTNNDIHFHHSRVIDLWSLLPCFCSGASDVAASLPALAQTMVRALSDKRYPQLAPIICGALHKLVDFVATHASETDKEAVRQAATVLLPKLFQLVSDTKSETSGSSDKRDGMELDVQASLELPPAYEDMAQSQVILTAISSLLSCADEGFVDSIFRKLMHTLVENLQSQEDTNRICALLSLSQALIVSEVLNESQLTIIYRALRTIIRDDGHGARAQKRAYKVLTSLCHHHHSFVANFDRLKETTSLLISTMMTSHVSARSMRLKCLKLLVDGFDDVQEEHLTEFYGVVTEVLLCLKDNNAKTREGAFDLLLSISKRGGNARLTRVIAAALGAETQHMRSAAVMAFSRLVFEFAWDDADLQANVPSLLKTVLVMLDEDSREVAKSVIGLIRICVAAIPPEQLEPLLPDLVGGILKYPKTKDRFRAKIKIILKKLVKLFGYEALAPLVPKTETRLLSHIRKLDRRKKQKKEALKEQRANAKANITSFDDLLGSDEEDSDAGVTLTSGLTGRTRASRRLTQEEPSMRSKSLQPGTVKSGRSLQGVPIRLPGDSNGEVLDMLDQYTAHKAQFVENQDDGMDSDSTVGFDDTGRLIVREEPVEESTNDRLDPIKKRARRSEIAVEATAKRRKRSGTQIGAAFKSNKAGGDVKRKGQKYEPFAYVPLDGRAYSKKNRRSTVDQMSTVVRKGANRKHFKT